MKRYLVCRGEVQEIVQADTASQACERSKYPDAVTLVMLISDIIGYLSPYNKYN